MEETPAQPTPTKLAKEPVKKVSNLTTAIVLLVIIAIIVGVVILLTGGAKAKYQASSTGIAVIDPATVSVSFQVKNIGKASGTPNCTINVQDASYSHTGFNSGKLSSSLAPGQTTSSAMSITVTGQGANDITSAKVSCN